MSGVGYCAAVLLAAVFTVAAVAKVRTPNVTAATFRRLGVPAAGAVARVVPGVELVVAVALLAAPRIGAAAAAVLLAAFTAVLSRAVARHVDVTCGCFGTASSTPVTWVTLFRNALLLIAAATTVVFTGDVTRPSPAAVVLVTAAALVGTVAVAIAGRVSPTAPARPADGDAGPG